MQENENSITNTVDSILKDISELILIVQICQECDADNINDWLTCDCNDQRLQIMSDDDIVHNILQVNEEQEIKENVDVK